MNDYSLAIDLGGTTAKCALIQKEVIIERLIVDTKKGKILENIYENLEKLFNKYKIKSSNLEFIAITICGLIDYEKGISIWAGNLEWRNYPVAQKLEEIFSNKNIFILNDSKSATYGEYVKGIEFEKSSMILYTIGTGLGGSVILDHKLYFGNNTKLASEPGHSGGFQDLYQCNCGLPGCVEGLSSATGIEKELNKQREYINSKLFLKKDKITIKDVSILIEKKDPIILKIMQKCLTPLAKHIAVSLHLMDFEIVVLGGGPSALEDNLIEIVKKILKNYLLEPFYKKLDLRVAKLGNDAGIWGVYYWAKEKIKNAK